MLHVHVLLAAPLGSGYMTKPCADQHQRRVPVRKCSDHPCPAPDLTVHPLDYIVGSDLRPMLGGKVTVGQRFLDTRLNLLRSLRQLHGLQFRNHCGSLFTGCLLALLCVDGFQHFRHIFDLGFGHNGEYISVKMHYTALVFGFRKHLSHSPLQGGKYPYVYVDGIYLKRNWGGEYENVAVLVAIAVNEDGYREVLGAAEGMKEDKASWVSFFQWLRGRGLEGVKLIVGDKCLGMLGTVAPSPDIDVGFLIQLTDGGGGHLAAP